MFAPIRTPRTTYGYARIVESDLILRRASSTDVPALRRWDAAAHVMAVSGDDEPWEWEREIDFPWQEVWIGEVDGRAIGVVILLDAYTEPSHYWGEVSPGTYAIDIWIGEVDALHRGYGVSMMRHAIDRAFNEHNAREILIDPLATNTNAIGFYRHMGFDEVGPRRFGADDCVVLAMRPPSGE